MPELPEVESVAAALRLNLQGRRVTGLNIRFPGVFRDPPGRVSRAVVGKQLEGVHRHGKYLILNFAADTHLMLHLRMTGQIFVRDDYLPDQHVHAVFDFEGVTVHYRDIRKFGRFVLVDDARRPSAIEHVGPDVLRVRFPDWQRRIAGRRAPIKALLLDQGIAAGLGNIYVDEALHRAGVRPDTPASALRDDELRLILARSKEVLRSAISHGGTTFLNFTNFHGKPGDFRRKLRVYQRTGEPCRACGTLLERMRVAGRSSHYCPVCQPARMPR
ncbi:MAG: bifunctional DNA-formamidopyrimidine glycosylase/DNA-(apurinic or apyrimidinic site) lyase [Candidatus Krumholzibacteriia bacterium]